MKNLLKELWSGNVNPRKEYEPQNEEIKELEDLIERNRQHLLKMINEEQKGVLNVYTECINDAADLYFEEIFALGFSTGMKFAFEALL